MFFYEVLTFPRAREIQTPPTDKMPNTAKAILKLARKSTGSVWRRFTLPTNRAISRVTTVMLAAIPIMRMVETIDEATP